MAGSGPSISGAASTLAAWEHGVGEDALGRAATLLAAVRRGSSTAGAEVDLGTRDSALLGLLESYVGPVVWCTLSCSSCGDDLDVPVDLSALPRESAAVAPSGAGRLPTTADLMAVAACASESSEASAQEVLRERCGFGSAEEFDRYVTAASPLACVTVDVECPSCTAVTCAALDVPLLVWPELETRALALMNEVHVLAKAYGWTESYVLALSPAKRAAYLEMAGGEDRA